MIPPSCPMTGAANFTTAQPSTKPAATAIGPQIVPPQSSQNNTKGEITVNSSILRGSVS
jgi:hypothetical protein